MPNRLFLSHGNLIANSVCGYYLLFLSCQQPAHNGLRESSTRLLSSTNKKLKFLHEPLAQPIGWMSVIARTKSYHGIRFLINDIASTHSFPKHIKVNHSGVIYVDYETDITQTSDHKRYGPKVFLTFHFKRAVTSCEATFSVTFIVKYKIRIDLKICVDRSSGFGFHGFRVVLLGVWKTNVSSPAKVTSPVRIPVLQVSQGIWLVERIGIRSDEVTLVADDTFAFLTPSHENELGSHSRKKFFCDHFCLTAIGLTEPQTCQ